MGLGVNPMSLEELVRQWRLGTEYAEAVADLQQGIIDDAERKAQTIANAFAEIRSKLGIAD